MKKINILFIIMAIFILLFVGCGKNNVPDANIDIGCSFATRLPAEIMRANNYVAMITDYEVQDKGDTIGFNIEVENKSDETIIALASDVSINDYMIDPYWIIEVEPHSTIKHYMNWNKEELTSANIHLIDAVNFLFEIVDYVNNEVICSADFEMSINNYKHDLNIPVGKEEIAVERGKEFDFVITDLIHAPDGEEILIVEMSNKTEDDVYINFYNIAINGLESDEYWCAYITANSKKTDEVSFSEDMVKVCGADTLKTLAFQFCVEKYDGGEVLYTKDFVCTFD